jgi:hypothetical protein
MRLRLKLEQTEEKFSKLYENLVEGILAQEDYQDLRQHYMKEKEMLRQKIKEAEQEQRAEDMRLERFMELEANLEQHLGEKSLNEQLVGELIERIEISEEQGIVIRFTCEDVFDQVVELAKEGME